MTPEGKVKAKVNKALATLGTAVYRFMPVQMGMGAPTLDYLLCVYGAFVAIETKVEGKVMTPRQCETSQQIVQAGGHVFVVRNDYDVTQMMARLALLREFGK